MKKDKISVINSSYALDIVYQSEFSKSKKSNKNKEYKQYRENWHSRPHESNNGDYPLNLNVETTSKCNLACTFCNHPSLKDNQMMHMDNMIYAKIVKDSNGNVPAININGLGEPLLRKDLSNLIKSAKDHGFIDVFFHTNGTIMTEKIARELINAGLDRILFSVDSPDKDTYESIRLLRTDHVSNRNPKRGTKFERTVHNVKLFNKIRAEYKECGPLVRVSMVLTSKTVNQVRDAIELWKGHVDEIAVQDLIWRTKEVEDGDWENLESSDLTSHFKEISDKAKQFGYNYECAYLFQSMFVLSNGDVTPCSSPNARKSIVMGNIKNNSIKEIWNNEKYKKLRRIHTEHKFSNHKYCSSCEIALTEIYKSMIKDGYKFSFM